MNITPPKPLAPLAPLALPRDHRANGQQAHE
jgi:hypothetical protein